jgi:uncharacterized protein YjiS (DUF1127 family)
MIANPALRRHSPIAERIADLRDAWRLSRARRRIYDQAMAELGHIDEREMMDLGISPSMFHDIALQEVARKLPQAA